MDAEIKDQEIKEEDLNQEEDNQTQEESKETPDFDVSSWSDLGGQSDEDLASQVPVGKHVRMKHELRGKLSERDQEIERLRQENESLKGSGHVQQTKSLEVPKLEDYETDDDYNKALASYIDNKIKSESVRQQEQMTEQSRISQVKKKRDIEVNSHYARANEFVNKSKIKPDLYNQADKVVRDAIDLVSPGNGDLITDQLISVLGDGSEKVMYYLGVNSTARNKLHSLLLEDSTGMKAIAYLGGVKNKISNPIKMKTNAPDPSQPLQEDPLAVKGAKATQRDYQKAMEKDDVQKAFDIRAAARAQGIDVKDW